MRRRTLMAAAVATGIAPAGRATTKTVVLELFTSQGCSSCPPADALLGQLAKRPDVIALAWHVDYWDRLGWHDPFASREATARQRTYARRLGSTVFTPALVVNGASIIVGSDAAAVDGALDAASPLAVPVALRRSENGLVVEIGAGPGPMPAPGWVVHAAYDAEHTTPVDTGENEGQRLREYRIVRQAEVLDEWDGSPRRFNVSAAGFGQGQVILVQSADLRVVGAADQPPA